MSMGSQSIPNHSQNAVFSNQNINTNNVEEQKAHSSALLQILFVAIFVLIPAIIFVICTLLIKSPTRPEKEYTRIRGVMGNIKIAQEVFLLDNDRYARTIQELTQAGYKREYDLLYGNQGNIKVSGQCYSLRVGHNRVGATMYTYDSCDPQGRELYESGKVVP